MRFFSKLSLKELKNPNNLGTFKFSLSETFVLVSSGLFLNLLVK